MARITRIEVANWLNLDQVKPSEPDWVPHWRHVVLNLAGKSTAIQLENGYGKTTLVRSILGLLTRNREFVRVMRACSAPKRHGVFSHVRVEFRYGEDARIDDMFAMDEAAPGELYVFGYYGYSDKNETANFYNYQGSLDDCPVATREGVRVTIKSVAEFKECLERQNRCSHNPTVDDWSRQVREMIDRATLDQMVAYQKAGAGDSNEEFFPVKCRPGELYDTAFFFRYLAPELLVRVMRDEGEEDEHRFEDTILNSTRPVIAAERRMEKKSVEVAACKRSFEAFEMLSVKQRDYVSAIRDYRKECRALVTEMAFLKEIVLDCPLIGLPPRKSPDHPDTAFFADRLVLVGGEWMIPDRALAEVMEIEPKHVNENAIRKNIQSKKAGVGQVIEKPCDHGLTLLNRRHGGGEANRFYDLSAAVRLMDGAKKFAAHWNKEQAIRALNHGFAWTENNSDTNPLRAGLSKIGREIDEIEKEKRLLDETITRHDIERNALIGQLETLEASQAALKKMISSGLFSQEELESPEIVGLAVQQAYEASDTALSSHRTKVASLKIPYEEWRNFVERHGVNVDVAAYAENLQKKVDLAEKNWNEVKAELLLAREQRTSLTTKKDRLIWTSAALVEDLDSLNQMMPEIERFETQFFGENPEGLEARVRQELSRAENRKASLDATFKTLRSDITMIENFRQKHPDRSPAEIIAERYSLYKQAYDEKRTIEPLLVDMKRRREELDRAQVAAGKVAHETLTFVATFDASVRPLHEVVAHLDLMDDRRAAVLTHFSGLLFAPVLSNAALAVSCAEELSRVGIEAPVFVEDELGAFCCNGNLATSGKGVYSFIAGSRTRPVDCLLDPHLVEREKKYLDQVISDHTTKLAEQEAVLRQMSPDSEEGRNLTSVRQAIENDVEVRYSNTQVELKELSEALPNLQARASDEACRCIRVARAFAKKNGRVRMEELDQQIAELEVRKADVESAIQFADRAIEDMSSKEAVAMDAWRTAAQDAAVLDRLHRIAAFANENGPSFMASSKERELQLSNERSYADRRRYFEFSLAQQAVENKDSDATQIASKLEELRKELEAGRRREKELDAGITSRHVKSRELLDLIILLDRALAEIQGNWRRAFGIVNDAGLASFADLENDDGLPDTVRIARNGLEALKEDVDLEDWPIVVERIQELARDIDNFDIKGKADKIAHKRESKDAAWNNLTEAISRTEDDKTLDLSRGEASHLQRVRQSNGSDQDVQVIKDMFEHFEEEYQRVSNVFESAKKDVERQKEVLEKSLQGFTDRLEDNFDLMCRRLSWKLSNGDLVEAGIKISASIIDRSSMRGVIEDVIEEIKKAENSRAEASERGDHHESKDSYDSKMKAMVCNRFYRSVFKGEKDRPVPEIYLRHEDFRNGRPKRFDDGRSTGQGNALALMLMIKLADFMTERDAAFTSMPGSRKRRISARKNKVILIDGLFSNLSKKSLIDNSMKAMQRVRGNFQLIGLIHNPRYRNNARFFPMHIVLRRAGQKAGQFVYVDQGQQVKPSDIGGVDGEIASMFMHTEYRDGKDTEEKAV